jgi:hypothetical protein
VNTKTNDEKQRDYYERMKAAGMTEQYHKAIEDGANESR